DVRRELLALVGDLPSLLSGVGAGAAALGEAIELYQACVGFVCDSAGAEAVPLLRFVGKSGNATVFQWRTGREPRRVERPEPPEPPEDPKEDTVRGSKGWRPPRAVLGSAPRGSKGLGFLPPADRLGGFPRGAAPGGGDRLWDHDPEGVARGSDALTLLENPETRNQFIDELMELELFLAQRLLEMEDEAAVVAMSQLQLAPPVLQGQSSSRVRAQLATARELLARLCSRSVQHLCMILASPR
ncbi:CK5P3 protein, partial [Ptilonorhynchus violaceus]|nr:CK5P3 protein [Ptilonorhynchus violaceus]